MKPIALSKFEREYRKLIKKVQERTKLVQLYNLDERAVSPASRTNATHSEENPWQYSPQPPRDRSKPPQSTLLSEPFGRLSLNLFLTEHAAFLDIFQSALDLLPHVDVVLDVPERRVIWNLVKYLPDFFFRRTHVHPLLNRRPFRGPKEILSETHMLDGFPWLGSFLT